MKKLVLLRHAKSSWEYDVEDRNRPLTENGIKRIVNMAKSNPSIFLETDVIYSSPANRALHSATLIMQSLSISFEKLKIDERLYTFESQQLLSFINKLDDVSHKVVCVGHNPAFSIASGYLSNSNIVDLPTAAWATIQFNQNQWSKVENGILSLGLPKEILK